MNINIGRITAGFLQSKHLHCREWSFVITGICIGSTLGNYYISLKGHAPIITCVSIWINVMIVYNAIHINNKKKTQNPETLLYHKPFKICEIICPLPWPFENSVDWSIYRFIFKLKTLGLTQPNTSVWRFHTVNPPNG